MDGKDEEFQSATRNVMDKDMNKRDNIGQEAVNEAIKKSISAMKIEREKAFQILWEKDALAITQELDLHKEKESLVHRIMEKNRELTWAKEKNQKLKEDLCAAEQELSQMSEKSSSGLVNGKKQERKSKVHVKETRQENRELFTEHILLRNAVEKLEKECEQLRKKHMLDVIDLKKKYTRKEIQLEKKTAELTNVLENGPAVAPTPEVHL